MKGYKIIITALLIITAAGCSSLKLTQTDFSWPVESVLKIDSKGFVTDTRFSYSVNVKPLFFEETKDSLNYASKELRIIRDTKGYYYATSAGFKNIYLFEVKDGAFKLYDKFELSETGLTAPVMNQRPPYVELIDGAKKYLLNNEGLKK
jgi:polysaccharide pyruvyl transferase WcaK-like protein